MNFKGSGQKAIIICGGTIKDYKFYKDYLEGAEIIICADGGAEHARRFGLVPDVLIGDFDSIRIDDLEFFKNAGLEIIRYPAEKDFTDTELAVSTAVDRGFNNLILLGASGTRIDHSLSNILMMKKLLEQGICCTMANEHNEASVVKDRLVLKNDRDARVSLLALSDRVEGVTIKGLRYPLQDAVLEMGSSLGISNEFISDTAEISVRSGILLVVKAWD